MGNAFINSLIVTIPSTAIPITIAAFAAYAFAWIPFRGRGILFTIVVALLVVPIQMSLIPILQIYSAGNLYGSFLGIWLAHTGFGLPLAIFLLYNFMSQLPRDLFESAAIDGASHLQTFIRIVLPLSIPALGAFAIFQFLWVWNDLLVALVFLGPGADVRVLPTALYQLIGSRGGSWHLLTAGAFITMVVPLLVFLLLQRAFVQRDPGRLRQVVTLGAAHDRSRNHGMGLRDEILEQPAAAQRLLDAAPTAFAPIAAAMGRAGRGSLSSPRAAPRTTPGSTRSTCWRSETALIVALAAPSTITLYGARPNMADALVVGISQSGRSPDIVAVVEEARRQGALTVALTNDAAFSLGRDGRPRGRPACRTGAGDGSHQDLHDRVARGGAAVDGTRPARRQETADLAGLPALISAALTAEPHARDLAAAHAKRQRAVVLGRGYSYASAREWALKLQEMALVAAMPYSAADFEHGPLALARPVLPVLAVAPSGAELEAQVELFTRLKEDHGARLLVISDAPAAREIDEGLALPDGIPSWLAPIVEIMPAQLYAYHLTVARGLDPEQPRTIRKVTETR